jgi:hypothetical protein
MFRIKTFGLMLMAVFAFSAVASSMSSAVEGPFFKVNGKTLGAGEERVLLASAKENFRLEAKALLVTITCTGLSLPDPANRQIIGQAAGNGDTSREVIHFTGCTQTGNGTECEVVNKLTITLPLFNLLGYGNAARTGTVLVLFEPIIGTVLAHLFFTGTNCKLPQILVSGSVVGVARVGGVPVPIGGGTETLHGEVAFPHPNLIFIERSGVLKHVKAGLTIAGGNAATLTGVALLLVDENGVAVPWGVFS